MPAGKTNTLAIVALALGIVVPRGGVISGPITLRHLKRTGEGGRGLTIDEIVIGALLILLGIICTVALALIGSHTGAAYSRTT